MNSGSLNEYLLRSAAGHAVFLLAFAWFAHGRWGASAEVYHIDFIGATSGIINRSQAAPRGAPPVDKSRIPLPESAASVKPSPMKDPDDFPAGKVKKPLPRPSLLQNWRDVKDWVKETPGASPTKAALPSSASAKHAAADAGEGDGGPSISADMPNFPYPWYLTTVRSALWDRWAERMPPAGGECRVVFTILRDGGVVDLRAESSSGDGGLDYAALSAVKEASPFPPLPRGFRDPFLKVHVSFRSE